jgi:polar amino acid transport system substrate-binding protein
MKKRMLSLVLMAVMITGILSGCGKNSDKAASGSQSNAGTETIAQGSSEKAADGELERIKKSGKLIVGINADYAPYGFHANVDGKDTISGVDVEVANEVAKDMGVKVELLESNFDMLLSALQAGQCDVIISCLSPTEERKKQIDFSNMYSEDKVVAMIRKEDASKYSKFDDLKDKKIGCAYGTIQETLVKKQLPDSDVEYREGMAELFLELQAKQVDAVISTDSVCKMAIASNPDLAIADGSEFDTSLLGMDSEGAAVGIRKNSQSVVDSVNATIKRLKDAGDLEKFMDKSCELAAKNSSTEK